MTIEKQPNIFAHIKIMRKEIENELFHNNISYKLATFILNEIDEVLKDWQPMCSSCEDRVNSVSEQSLCPYCEGVQQSIESEMRK